MARSLRLGDEDEPLISMQLEDLVTSVGHEICGTAATHTQALEVVAAKLGDDAGVMGAAAWAQHEALA